MGKRVSNKKGKSRKSPARSTKTGRIHRAKVRVKKARLAAAKRRSAILEKMRKAFGDL